MNYGEIYDEIIQTIWGNSDPPEGMSSRLHGANGLIARKRKRITEKHNFWFMERTDTLNIADGKTDYGLSSDFKEEFSHGLRYSTLPYGDYSLPLVKISVSQIGNSFTDYDEETWHPPYYYIDYNSTTGNRRLNLKPNPQDTTYSVTLSTGTTPEQIATDAFSYVIDGTLYEKAAVPAGTAFSAADTINTGTATGTFWGVWLVQINTAGTISTKPGGGLSDQVYESEDEALEVLPDPDSGNASVGYLTIAATADSAWTAQTDDITSGSDNTSVTFYNTTTTLDIRYWAYLVDLSNVVATFDATEDDISKECPDLIKWMVVLDLAYEHNSDLIQIATREIGLEWMALKDKNWDYRNANKGRLPHRRL